METDVPLLLLASFWRLPWQPQIPNTWFHNTGTEQIMDNKWGLLCTHLSLLLITGRRQCRNAKEAALGAVRIRRVRNTSFGTVSIGAYIMDIFKSLPAGICSVGLSYYSLMSWSVHFHRDIRHVWLPNLTAPLPFISRLPLILSAQALRTTEGTTAWLIRPLSNYYGHP